MYNEIYKTKYLDTLKGTKKDTTTRLFTTTSLREYLLDKDIFSLSKEELIAVLRYTIGIQYVRHEAIQKAIKDVFEYRNWIKNNYPDEFVSEIEGIIIPKDIDCSEIYPYKFFENGTTLLSTLQQIFDKNTTRGFRVILTYLLLFNGIPIEQIPLITKEQIDFIHKEIIIKKTVNEKDLKIAMIPEFVGWYESAFNLISYQGERLRNIDPIYLFPMSSKNRNWQTYFHKEVNNFKDKSQKVFNSNFQNKLPILLEKKIIETNGIIYRTYLTKITGKSFLSIFDKYSKDLNDIYTTYVATFYH